MLKLFIANKNYSSWSLRPWVLMRELDIPFEENLTPFPDRSCWEDFRRFSPTGMVPCLHDDQAVIWESLGIVEYLAEQHDGVWPQSPAARAWARCATAEMHAGFSALRNECSMNCGIRIQLSSPSAALKKDLARLDELFNEGLNRFQGPFLAGDSFSAVDAFYAPVAFRVQSFNLPLSDTAAAYVKRLLDLDTMRDWYASALKEPWREIEHEKATLATGTLIEDCRPPVTKPRA